MTRKEEKLLYRWQNGKIASKYKSHRICAIVNIIILCFAWLIVKMCYELNKPRDDISTLRYVRSEENEENWGEATGENEKEGKELFQ
jgi:hypothetical protein